MGDRERQAEDESYRRRYNVHYLQSCCIFGGWSKKRFTKERGLYGDRESERARKTNLAYVQRIGHRISQTGTIGWAGFRVTLVMGSLAARVCVFVCVWSGRCCRRFRAAACDECWRNRAEAAPRARARARPAWRCALAARAAGAAAVAWAAAPGLNPRSAGRAAAVSLTSAPRSCRGRCRSSRCAATSPRTSRRRTSPSRTPCRLRAAQVRRRSAACTCIALGTCNQSAFTGASVHFPRTLFSSFYSSTHGIGSVWVSMCSVSLSAAMFTLLPPFGCRIEIKIVSQITGLNAQRRKHSPVSCSGAELRWCSLVTTASNDGLPYWACR